MLVYNDLNIMILCTFSLDVLLCIPFIVFMSSVRDDTLYNNGNLLTYLLDITNGGKLFHSMDHHKGYPRIMFYDVLKIYGRGKHERNGVAQWQCTKRRVD